MFSAGAGALVAVLVSLPLAALLLLFFRGLRYWERRRRRLPADLRFWYERPWLVRSAVGVLSVYAAILAWGMGVEARWVERTRTTIPVPGGVLGRERFRVVHLSDFHLGRRPGLRERRLLELTAEAKPDLIVMTGDYMDVRSAHYALKEVVDALVALAPPFGVWAVGGPVDEKFVARDILKRAGVEWLEDETRLIERDGKRLRLAGRGAWPLLPFDELFAGLDAETPTILLQHGPSDLDATLAGRRGARVDLVLCGHTHGGQILLPLRGALVATPGGRDRGLYDLGGVPLYVNRGLGTTGLPLRLGARPEVAVLDLVPK